MTENLEFCKYFQFLLCMSQHWFSMRSTSLDQCSAFWSLSFCEFDRMVNLAITRLSFFNFLISRPCNRWQEFQERATCFFFRGWHGIFWDSGDSDGSLIDQYLNFGLLTPERVNGSWLRLNLGSSIGARLVHAGRVVATGSSSNVDHGSVVVSLIR